MVEKESIKEWFNYRKEFKRDELFILCFVCSIPIFGFISLLISFILCIISRNRNTINNNYWYKDENNK